MLMETWWQLLALCLLSPSLSLFSYQRVSRGAFSSVEHRNYYQEEGDKVGRATPRETDFCKLRIIYGRGSFAAGGRKANFKSFHARMEESDGRSSITTYTALGNKRERFVVVSNYSLLRCNA